MSIDCVSSEPFLAWITSWNSTAPHYSRITSAGLRRQTGECLGGSSWWWLLSVITLPSIMLHHAHLCWVGDTLTASSVVHLPCQTLCPCQPHPITHVVTPWSAVLGYRCASVSHTDPPSLPPAQPYLPPRPQVIGVSHVRMHAHLPSLLKERIQLTSYDPASARPPAHSHTSILSGL